MKPLHIRVVDDAPDDIFLFRRAIETLGAPVTIAEMSTLAAASAYLKKEFPHENAPTPDLIVSDSVFDRESGQDLLEWVRVHPSFKNVPFVLLTGNTNPAVTVRGQALGATRVLQKPARFNDLVSALGEVLAVVSNPQN